MNSPRRPDGPPVRDGKPYSAIAHLAERRDAVHRHGAWPCASAGFSAPAIFAADREAGLLVIEDLGNELVVAGEPPAPIEARYEVAVDLLAALHREPLPDLLPVEAGVDYRLPRYDMDALLIEVELLLDWYLPKLEATVSDSQARRAISRSGATRCSRRWRRRPTWVLRDFHSPNLLWLPEREGVARIGLLDFQDAVMGPAAYDLASLLQDARVDVPEMMEIALLSRYTRARLSRRCRLRRAGFRAALCDAGRAARLQDPRHLRAAGAARRQAAISASSAARMGLSAALAGASGAGAARCLVSRQRAGAEGAVTMTTHAQNRHGAGRRPRHAHAPAHRHACRSRWCKVAGKALLDHVLDRLAEAGVERAVVNVHHFAEQIDRRISPAASARAS